MNDLDRLTEAYLAALDAGDFPALDRMWDDAAFDPELERTLFEIEAAIDADDRERDDREAARIVGAAVETHLKSAEILRPEGGPVTVGDVARELLRHPPAGLPAAAYALNERLLSAAATIPSDLGFSKFVAWAEAQFGGAGESYWEAFYSGIIKLELRAGAEREFQLAARAAPKPEDRR